jgi:hypothetical protein
VPGCTGNTIASGGTEVVLGVPGCTGITVTSVQTEFVLGVPGCTGITVSTAKISICVRVLFNKLQAADRILNTDNPVSHRKTVPSDALCKPYSGMHFIKQAYVCALL